MMKVRRMWKNSPMSMFARANTLQMKSIVSRMTPHLKVRGKAFRKAWVFSLFFNAQTWVRISPSATTIPVPFSGMPPVGAWW
jgi:hypothetical protein